MAFLTQLWLPILLSAVLVFVASSILHMVLKYHNVDYRKLPNEDEVRAAINAGRPAPGQYIIPYMIGADDFKAPGTAQKFTEGPVGLLRLSTPSFPKMGSFLGAWFVSLVVISLIVGYVAYHTLPPGTPYLGVFRVVGVVAFLAYAGASSQQAIWRHEPWSVTIKSTLDGLIYALVTAGTFGWLWPKG